MATRSRVRPVVRPREDGVLKAVTQYLAHRPDVLVWRSNTGAMPNPRGRLVRFGVRGSADLTGLLRPSGVRLEIEVKRPGGGKQTDDQAAYEASIRSAGGVYILVRSVEECRAKLDAAIAALR